MTSNLFEYQYDRCNQRNNQTYNYLVKGQKLHEQPLRKLIEQPFDLFSGGVPLWSECWTTLFKYEDCMIYSCWDETSNSS